MKKLILIRHAKTEPGAFGINDFDRQLTNNGKEATIEISARLKEKGIMIDALFSSTAKRAKATADAFIKEFSLQEEKVFFINDLYLPPPNIFFQIIAKTENQVATLAVVSHNDGITNFANMLTNTRIDNIPTCGVFAVIAECKSWEEFKNASKEFWFFEAPKK